MDLPEDLRHLFLSWIQAEYTTKSQVKSRMAHTYYNAIKSLKQYPNAIKHPQELIDLKYFGTKMVSEMENKLAAYCEEYGYDLPALPEHLREKTDSHRKRKKDEIHMTGDSDPETPTAATKKKAPGKPRQRSKRYVPAIYSGGYAILMSLHIHDKNRNGLSKNDIIKYATPYCTSSFQANPSTGSFYSSWSSINTLIKNEYIEVQGNPKYYSLTDQGIEVATVLKELGNGSLTVKNVEIDNDTSDTSINSSSVECRENKRINPLSSSSPQTSLISKNLTGTNINGRLSTSSPLKNIYSRAGTLEDREEQPNYQIWESGSYKIKFILDNREVFSVHERDFFSKTLKNLGVKLDVRSLPVGDGVWIAINKTTKQEATLNFIFERKRLDDLAGSITDGRYREQKSRLERTGMKSIFYIVEEQMGSDISKFSEAIQTCICMNTTYSGFHTIRTKDPDQTMGLINDLTDLIKKLHHSKSLLVLEPRNITTQQQYTGLLNRMRKQYAEKEVVYSFNTFNDIMGKTAVMNIKQIFVKMLMTIKGVGLDKACAIQAKFKTPRSLLETYGRLHNIDPTGNKCALLIFNLLEAEIGPRKIGKALSTKIASVWCKKCAVM